MFFVAGVINKFFGEHLLVKRNKKNKPLITPLGYEVQFCKKLDPNMKKIKKKIKKIKF